MNDAASPRPREGAIFLDVKPCAGKGLTGIGRMTRELLWRWKTGHAAFSTWKAYAVLRTEEEEAALRRNLPFLSGEELLSIRGGGRAQYYRRKLHPAAVCPEMRRAAAAVSFNYSLPTGISGKKAVFVCDMVLARFPETMDKRNRAILALTLKHTCRRADRILTISEFSKREIMECMGVPEEKLRVITLAADREIFHTGHAAADLEACRSKYGIRGDYFLYGGTIEPRKNVQRLIEAYAGLIADMAEPPALVLAGGRGWKSEAIYEAAAREDVRDHIVFTGFIPDEDLSLLMEGCLAFVFPSLYEGFGLPPLEAMCCAAPVISSSAASLPEVVGDAGLLVDPHNTEEIREALRKLAADPALRAELKEKSLRRSAGFSWEKSAAQLEDALRELLAER